MTTEQRKFKRLLRELVIICLDSDATPDQESLHVSITKKKAALESMFATATSPTNFKVAINQLYGRIGSRKYVDTGSRKGKPNV